MNQVSVYKMFFIIYSKFIRKMIWANKLKIVSIFLSIILFYYSQTVQPSIYEYPIVECISFNNSDNYIINKNNKLEVLSLDDNSTISSDQRKVIVENYELSNLLLLLSIIISFIILLIVITSLFNDAEDIYHHNDIKRDVIRSLCYVVEENGVYYYMIFDRLIKSSNVFEVRYSATPISINEILNLPRFETKQQKRENIFTILGL